MSDRAWAISDQEQGSRLDKFLASPDRLGSRSKAASALERGKIFVNGDEVGLDAAARLLSHGDTVRVWMDRPGTAKAQPRIPPGHELDIIFEDDQMVVINKPAGLLSVPPDYESAQPSVYDFLEERFRSFGKRRPLVVHRIDQDTSGLVLFAKHAEAHRRLKAQFARHEPERVYLAVVHGHPKPAQGTWTDRLVWDDRAMIQKATHPRDPNGSDAQAHYRTVERFADAALVEVRLVTGRRNQIRLQARLRGHPLVGDARYRLPGVELPDISFGRQALHAARLSVEHPTSRAVVTFESPLPADMQELIRRLQRRANSRRQAPV